MADLPQGKPLRVVLLGKTGVGKSAVGNTILGTKTFISRPSANSITDTCKKACLSVGRIIDVIDTPGIIDTEKPEDEIKKEILRCIQVSCPGPHAFLLVIQVGRFTKEEQNAVRALQEIFGEKAADYMIVLFTRGDELEELDQSISDYVLTGSPKLREVVKSCGGRYHVFNNKEKSRDQVATLINTIDQMVAVNGGAYFTECMYEEMTKVVEEKGESFDVSAYKFTFLLYLWERLTSFKKVLDE